MTSTFRRVLGAASALATAFGLVAMACGGTPTDEMVGKKGQRCFPGDFCDKGLTCLATPIPADGSSTGTDGGQCFDLRDGDTPEARAEDIEDAGAEAE